MTNANVSIIIPALNEESSVGKLISRIRELHPDYEVIVVNDGSTDQTAKVAKEAGARVYSHPYRIGNGAAVKAGIRQARGDVLVFMDADGQHKPEEIEKLLAPIPRYDMVVGARQKGGQASVGRALGNRVYNLLASYVAKFKVEDLTSGFRAVKANIARQLLYLLPNSYSYPTTLTLSVLRNGLTLKYVPISVRYRTSGKSQINLVKDGTRFFLIIVKICTLYSPFRIFLPISAYIYLLGMVYYLYTYITINRFTNMSALMFTTSVIVFMIGLVSEQISQMRYDRSENMECPQPVEWREEGDGPPLG